MTDHDETARLFDDEAVRKAFEHPDWPRGTEVVVYARKEDREKALVKMSQMGYVVTEFVEVSGLQAEIMGDGRLVAAKADLLRPKPVRWEPSPYSVVKAWQDRIHNNVIYPSRVLIEQMKRDYPICRSQMLGVPGMSDDKTKE